MQQIGTHDNVSNDFSPTADAEVDFILIFTRSMKVISAKSDCSDCVLTSRHHPIDGNKMTNLLSTIVARGAT
jgi:hypothetical protein